RGRKGAVVSGAARDISRGEAELVGAALEEAAQFFVAGAGERVGEDLEARPFDARGLRERKAFLVEALTKLEKRLAELAARVDDEARRAGYHVRGIGLRLDDAGRRHEIAATALRIFIRHDSHTVDQASRRDQGVVAAVHRRCPRMAGRTRKDDVDARDADDRGDEADIEA